MQPLKRFTQCGSLTMLVTVFIVLFGVSSTALTTFGKSPNPPPPPPTQAAAKARNCTKHSDCSAIQNTSCVKDDDAQYRCLCGDNVVPSNGQCSKARKELRHVCADRDQCNDQYICVVENTTKTTSLAFKPSAGETKICLCDEEQGYKEDTEDNKCNGAVQILTGLLLPLASLFFGLFLSMKRVH